MSAIYFLIPLALIVSLGFLGLFFWSLKSDQYEDLQGAAHRIFTEDEDIENASNTPKEEQIKKSD